MTEPSEIALKISRMAVGETVDDVRDGLAMFLAGFIILHAEDQDEAMNEFLEKLAGAFEDINAIRAERKAARS